MRSKTVFIKYNADEKQQEGGSKAAVGMFRFRLAGLTCYAPTLRTSMVHTFNGAPHLVLQLFEQEGHRLAVEVP